MKRYLLLILLFPFFAHAQTWQKTGNALQYKVRAPLDTVWAFNLGTPTNNLLSFTPHGGGGGSGTVTTVTGVNANGFTWSIANPTTTPALTLQLQTASTTIDGKLSHTDWNTFNGKLSPTGSAAGLTGLLSAQVTTALGFTPVAGPTLYTGSGSLSGNTTVTTGNKSLEFLGANVNQGIDVLFDNTSGGSSIVIQTNTNSTTTEKAFVNMQAAGGVPPFLRVGVRGLLNKDRQLDFDANSTGGIRIQDDISLAGAFYNADYSANFTSRSIPDVAYVLAHSGSGTVTAVTGTTNRITSTGGTTPQIDISASYAGQSSIVNVGTLVSGVIDFSLLSGTPPTWNQNTTGTALNITATSNSTLTTLSALSLPYSQLTGTPSLASYLTAIGVTSANGVSGTSSGGTTPNLTITLGAITPTSTNGVLAATMAFNDATSSIQTQLNGKQASGSYALQSTTISAGTGLSGGGSLAANRTLSADTTVLQTVLNFKPLGSTYWLSKTASTLPSSFTASSLTSFGSSPTLNTAVLTGLPTGTGVSNTSSASTLAARDANGNISANSFQQGFTTIVSSSTPIVLTAASPQLIEITGSTAQTITLPVTGTIPVGWEVKITSASSATITVQSSGGNTVASLLNGNTGIIWNVLATGTGLASWDRTVGVGSLSGTSGGGVLSTGATMNTLTLTGTTTTAAITAGASSITAGVFNNTKAGAGTTPNGGITITNSTAATVGTQNQYGLDLTWAYSAWNTGGTPAANQQLFKIEPRSINGATTGGNVFYSYQNNGGGYVDAYSFGSNGTLSLLTVGGELKIAEGSGGFVGQTTLVSGTKAITVTGVTTSSRVFVSLVSQGGTVTTTTAYAGVATANTITITALTNAGVTDTTDTSVLNYQIIN